MRKAILLLLACFVLVSFSGCGEESAEPVGQNSSKSSVSSLPEDDIVDLTKLSNTVLYAQVNNIMSDTESYLGKTIKVSGKFSAYKDESTGNIYYACLISDSTACCVKAFEFVLKDERFFPDQYPAEGEIFTVMGAFDVYSEGQYKYCRLNDAVIIEE